MINNIHKWLIIRLALVWLVLSLVIGSLVQYVGRTRLDDHVIKMAQESGRGMFFSLFLIDSD